jgi:hypothetical protein
MIDVMNPSDDDRAIMEEILSEDIAERKKQLIENITTSYNTNIANLVIDIDKKFDKEIQDMKDAVDMLYSSEISQLIESCLPFDSKIEEIKDAIKR